MEIPEVIMENCLEHTIRQTIMHKGITYEVFGNVRKEAGDFEANYFCSICDPSKSKFNPKLLQIGNRLVCSRCIHDFAEVLNAATLSDCKKGRDDK